MGAKGNPIGKASRRRVALNGGRPNAAVADEQIIDKLKKWRLVTFFSFRFCGSSDRSRFQKEEILMLTRIGFFAFLSLFVTAPVFASLLPDSIIEVGHSHCRVTLGRSLADYSLQIISHCDQQAAEVTPILGFNMIDDARRALVEEIDRLAVRSYEVQSNFASETQSSSWTIDFYF